jgi:hypothetical protein
LRDNNELDDELDRLHTVHLAHTIKYKLGDRACVQVTLVRGVLGNKCAGQYNLKTVHLREELASGNFLAGLSGVCVFFGSALSTLGRRGRAFM